MNRYNSNFKVKDFKKYVRSNGLEGRPVPEKTRKKISKALKGKHQQGRPLTMTIKVRKKAAWDALSLYVRLKYSDRGLVNCYTCGNPHHYKDMDAGHGIGSRSNSVLFMEEIVKPQCTRCNRYLNGNYKVFQTKLIEELGIEKWEELRAESNRTKIFSPSDYLEKEKEYKEKLSNLES